MADRYLIESSTTDGYLLEDGSGVLLLEVAGPDVIIVGLDKIEQGLVELTAVTLGGVLQE